jgi:hypothetical protein
LITFSTPKFELFGSPHFFYQVQAIGLSAIYIQTQLNLFTNENYFLIIAFKFSWSASMDSIFHLKEISPHWAEFSNERAETASWDMAKILVGIKKAFKLLSWWHCFPFYLLNAYLYVEVMINEACQFNSLRAKKGQQLPINLSTHVDLLIKNMHVDGNVREV